jgi:NADH-quinone oxidoreductase subunit J
MPLFYWLYAAMAVGAVGLCLALPSTGPAARKMRVAGEVVGAAGLAGVAAYLTSWIGPAFAGRVFVVIFSVLAIAAAVPVVSHPRPVYCALYFVIVVLSVTGLCILAAAEFLAVALVIVYAGAILVTYVFVIMLAQQSGSAAYDTHAREPLAAVVVSFILLAAITQAMVTTNDPIVTSNHSMVRANGTVVQAPSAKRGDGPTGATAKPQAAGGETIPLSPPDARNAVIDPSAMNGTQGNVRTIGRTLLTTYVVAVELAGVLLLVAMVGAIAIAQKRIEPSALTPHEQTERRHAAEDLHRAGREAAPY